MGRTPEASTFRINQRDAVIHCQPDHSLYSLRSVFLWRIHTPFTSTFSIGHRMAHISYSDYGHADRHMGGGRWHVGAIGLPMQIRACANSSGTATMPICPRCRQELSIRPASFRQREGERRHGIQTERSKYNYEISRTINLDGYGQRRLTENVLSDHYPVWSPDGSRIAFICEPTRSYPGMSDMNWNSTRWLRMGRTCGTGLRHTTQEDAGVSGVPFGTAWCGRQKGICLASNRFLTR